MEENNGNVYSLNDQETEKVAGGKGDLFSANYETPIHAPRGYITVHTTPENIPENEIPCVMLYGGDIVMQTHIKENDMTYVQVKKNGVIGWIPSCFLV